MIRRTRDRLIDSAGDLFYSSGFQAVGLDQVIRAVGITKTAFYKHFDSKDDLILAVLERRDRADIGDAIAYMRRHGGMDPRRQILAFFDQLIEWFERPDFRGCFFMNAATEFPSPNDPIHRAAVAFYDNLASELLLRLQAAGVDNPEIVNKQIMLLLNGAIAARHAGGVSDAAKTARAVVAALLQPAATPGSGNGHSSGKTATRADSGARRRRQQPLRRMPPRRAASRTR